MSIYGGYTRKEVDVFWHLLLLLEFSVPIPNISLSKINANKIFVPILTKVSQGVKVWIRKIIRSGSYEKEERY